MKFFCQPGLIGLLLFCCTGRTGFAQTDNLQFEHIGFEQGLSHKNVTSILQDRKGYLWIGTWDGLNKYDGYSFTNYKLDPLDPHSLSQNLIYTIFEDSDGAIWVSTFEGLCKLDPKTEKFTRYRPSPKAKFADPNISTITEDDEGMLWVGSYSGGLCRFDRKTEQFLPDYFDLGYKKPEGELADRLKDAIMCLYKDKSGTLWAGNTRGLHKIELATARTGKSSAFKHFSYSHDPDNPKSISDNLVLSIFEDRTGIIWVTTNNGLNSFDRKTNHFKRYLNEPGNNHSISSNQSSSWGGNGIQEDQQGNLWIGTANGLNRLNSDRTVFTAYRHSDNDPHSISGDQVECLEIDNAGILWAGSFQKGLNKVNLNVKGFGVRRNDPGNLNSLSSNEITCIAEDSSGIVWIGTYTGGLNRWDKTNNQFTHFRNRPGNPQTIRHDAILAMLEDSHGHLWVCNGDILSLLDKKTGKAAHFNTAESKYKDRDEGVIYSITEDREGFIWLGTGNGVKKFDERNKRFQRHYYHSKSDTAGISDYTAVAIFADSRDNIWVGFGSIGTDRIDKRTDIITHYKHDPNDTSTISSNIVNSFFEDVNGYIWMGTSGGGLCRFDYKTEKFTTYTEKHGLPDNTIYSILEDNNKHLWISTMHGLSRFDPITKKFTNFDYKDGLQSNFFAAGHRNRPSGIKGRDGTLYFGGSNGFNFFDPTAIKSNNTLAPVVITQFKLFDTLVKGASELSKIVLSHDQNYFSIEFSSLSFYNPAKNQYAYMLEGFDNDWVYSGSRRYAAYTNIDPGTYTFKVKATNNDGIWNEEGTSMTIIIRPPWWRTWWAYCIYGLLLVMAAMAVHRFQKQRVIRIEREKAQKKELAQAKEIEKAYHELRLTQSQLIQSEKMASLGELTAGIAHEIQNPLNFVNNFSEINRELISEMKEQLTRGNVEEAKSFAATIDENEEKINHHGKRADAIVKSMLQHSRSSNGLKEPTNINALADEYLRLSYHGLKARNKSFHAILKTDFDETIGNINIIRQDIGRVMLNLFNNAFYAVAEKKKQAGADYEPLVSVSTQKAKGMIEIRVKDNGTGIPPKTIGKIFQPFFTTKPPGQGTGLGLSLSYDIVRAHGGELKVGTPENDGAEFVIMLPVQE